MQDNDFVICTNFLFRFLDKTDFSRFTDPIKTPHFNYFSNRVISD